MSFHKVITGDCLSVLKTLDAGSIDAVVTDPPYNEVNRETGGLRTIDKGAADSAPIDIPALVAEFTRVCDGSIYVWCCTEQVSAWRRGFVDAGWTTRQGVWEKTNPSPMNGEHLWLSSVELCVFARCGGAMFNGFCNSPVWRGPSQAVHGHPTPKPIWLMQRAIEASTSEGMTVLDPFCGSGTTGVACKLTGRNFIGIEIDDGYATIARRRIADAASLFHQPAREPEPTLLGVSP